jgi:hypothetical protein
VSKFDGIFAATGEGNFKKRATKKEERAQEVTLATPKRGRPAKGKRSNPDFEQVTAYIRKRTHADVKIALLREGQKREFSALVEDLLAGWLASRL